ncbi:hypothetical protein F5Y19DRAFT_320027 [Xylariaceae sp. FL1651]|nr:hypothetical protein F5Y19DRAFT_320027 [Xylariaceae sp. FL1651]
MGDSSTKGKAARRDKMPDLPVVGNQRKWDITKVALRSFSIFLSVVVLGELIAFSTAYINVIIWPGIAYPAVAAILVWDIIEFVVMIVRHSVSNGINPAAHVGVELILWLGSTATVVLQAVLADWGELTRSYSDLILYEEYSWVTLAITELAFLGFLILLRFVFFVRACVEVDRRKKDRRIQQLVLAIQKQGQNPQDFPLSAFAAARDMDQGGFPTILPELSVSTRSTNTARSTATPQRPRSAPEERDFAYKYNFPIATVPELLESGIHPEDARNQKVLIRAFPR